MRAFIAMSGVLCGVFLGFSAHSEGGCPSGMVPFQFAPNQPPSCAPGGGGAPRAAEVWSARFGAVAADVPRDILGTATDMASARAAREAALADCMAKGGMQCVIKQPYRNGCAAVTISDPDGINFSAGPTLQEAEGFGMGVCIKAGAENCRISYSACSFPERIQ